MTRIKSDWRQNFVLLLMGCAFSAILVVSIVQRFTNPSLSIHHQPASNEIAENMAPGMQAIAELMSEVAKNPGDQAKLLRLVEALLAVGEWQAAENFAQKALALDVGKTQNPRALYLLALAHHNKGEHAEAAELLEKMLEQGENPSARYSLGILNVYYLNKPEEGALQFRKALELPNVSEGLQKSIAEELARLNKDEPETDGEKDLTNSESADREEAAD